MRPTFVLVSLVVLTARPTAAFTSVGGVTTTTTSRPWGTSSITELYGVRKSARLRRELADLNGGDGGTSGSSTGGTTARTGPKRRTSSKAAKKSNRDEAAFTLKSTTVSPALAEWAATAAPATEAPTTTTTPTTKNATPRPVVVVDEALSYTPFTTTPQQQQQDQKKKKKKKGSGERRTRQAERQAVQEAERQRCRAVAQELETLLESTEERDVDAVLDRIRALTASSNDAPATAMKLLTGGPTRRDYRMVWAGSDEAVCHVGTGLHKVPLARLQEVFVTIGKNRMEMYEIIRILGPFPNVKNTLQGDVSVTTPSSLHISYDSMIDGTGKEILAGKDENVRNVELETLFASEEIFVCRTPPVEGEVEDDAVLGSKNGSKLLVFVLDPDMETKFEILRVG